MNNVWLSPYNRKIRQPFGGSVGNIALYHICKEHSELSRDYKVYQEYLAGLNLSRGLTFGIPSGAFRLPDGKEVRVCFGMGTCAKWCMNLFGRARLPTIFKKHLANYFLTLREDFPNLVKKRLEELEGKYNVVRIHDDGDFYGEGEDDRRYFDKWLRIAEENPKWFFYGYSKSWPIVFPNREDWPENFTMVQSYGGRFDKKIDKSLPHAKVFVRDEARKEQGYLNVVHHDLGALLSWKLREHSAPWNRIGLVLHGSAVNPTMQSEEKKRIYIESQAKA